MERLEPQHQIIELTGVFDQTHKVAEAHAEARDAYRDKILSFRASPEEVEAWFYANDPTGVMYEIAMQTSVYTNDTETINSIRQDGVYDSLAMTRGGLTLLMKAYHPELFTEGEEGKWLERYLKELYLPGVESGAFDGPSNDEYSLDECVIDACYRKLENDNQISAKFLDTAYMAAEMLKIGTTDLFVNINGGEVIVTEDADAADALVDLHPSAPGIRPVYISGYDHDVFLNLVGRQMGLSAVMLKSVADFAVKNDQPEWMSDTEFDASRMLGLKAKVILAAMHTDWLNVHTDGEKSDEKEISEIIESMQSIFGDPSAPIMSRLKSPNVKGSLHEVLWFLDAYALRKLNPDTFGDVVVQPMYSHQDAPRIGYPEQRRGIDMTVSNKDIHDRIQLKSSAKKPAIAYDKPLPDEVAQQLPEEVRSISYGNYNAYFPTILVLQEPNFLEVNPRRLTAKLNTYQRWAESGYDISHKDNVSKYIMDTVKWELETITKRTSDRTTQLLNGIAAHMLLPMVERKYAADTSTKARRRRISRERRLQADE
jgi:hypothetical protein